MTVNTETVVGTGTSTFDGSYSVTVPAGNYDVKVTPPMGSPYATLRVANRAGLRRHAARDPALLVGDLLGHAQGPGRQRGAEHVRRRRRQLRLHRLERRVLVRRHARVPVDLYDYGGNNAALKLPNSFDLHTPVTVGSSGLTDFTITVPR